MKKILSWKNLLVILLASMFLGAGLRTSKNLDFLYRANFIDIFSGFVFLLLIITIGREVIKKYKQRKSITELVETKTNKMNLSSFAIFFNLLRKYLPDVLILVGSWLLFYYFIKPICGDVLDCIWSDQYAGRNYIREKMTGFIILTLGLDILIRRFIYLKNK